MHRDVLPLIGAAIRDRLTNLLWAQWAALGSGAVAERPVTAVIDPEALALSSLALVDHEPQLGELLAWLAAEGSGLLSVQRVRNLSARYPARVAGRLTELALRSRGAGDHRWSPLAARSGAAAPQGPAWPRASAGPRPPQLDGPGPVLLRLRLGLGVGMKADMVAALLGLEGWWTVRDLTVATGYTPRAVRRAAAELAQGGWLTASPASPVEYSADAARWLPLLGLRSPTPWVHWQPLFGFLLAVEEWIAGGGWEAWDLAAAERSARELVDAHRPAFKWAVVPVPPPVSRPGAEYIRAFAGAVEAVLERAEALL